MKSPWPTKKLGEICDFIFGYSFSSSLFNKDGRGLPVIKTGDIKNNFCENFYEGDYEEKYLVYPGDILIGLSGTIVSGCWKGETALLNQRVVKLVNFFNEVNKNFVSYILPIVLRNLEKSLWKGAVKNVLKYHLEDLQILLPPLTIQQKIVKILDTIQEAIEVQDKIIELTKELKRSVMADLFKYGAPSFRKRRKLKKTEIGEIPEDWEVVKLDKIFSIFAGGDLAKINYSPIKIDKFVYPIYSNTVEDKGLYGFSDSYQFPENCITITARGNVGYAIPRLEKFNAIIRLLVLVPKGKLNIVFVSEYINERTRVKIEGTSIPQLTVPKISVYKVLLPPLPEQQEIAEILQTIDKKIGLEKKKKTLYEELFRTMLNKIMKQEIDVEKVKLKL